MERDQGLEGSQHNVSALESTLLACLGGGHSETFPRDLLIPRGMCYSALARKSQAKEGSGPVDSPWPLRVNSHFPRQPKAPAPLPLTFQNPLQIRTLNSSLYCTRKTEMTSKQRWPVSCVGGREETGGGIITPVRCRFPGPTPLVPLRDRLSSPLSLLPS